MRTDPESLQAKVSLECEGDSDRQCKNVVCNKVEHGAKVLFA